MLYRIQADADNNGTIQPQSIQVFDADVITDPVTDDTTRGSLRPVDLSSTARQRIADAINAELAGPQKSAARLEAARTKAREQRERAAAVPKTFGDPEKLKADKPEQDR